MKKFIIFFLGIAFFLNSYTKIYGEIFDKAYVSIAYFLDIKIFSLNNNKEVLNLNNSNKRYQLDTGNYKAEILFTKSNENFEIPLFILEKGNSYLITLKEETKSKLVPVLLKHGNCYLYFENGNVKDKLNYTYDKLNGLSKEYSKDGVLKFIKMYENGKLRMQEFLDEKGKIETIEYYDLKGNLSKRLVRTRFGSLRKEYEKQETSIKPKQEIKDYELDYTGIIKQVKFDTDKNVKGYLNRLNKIGKDIKYLEINKKITKKIDLRIKEYMDIYNKIYTKVKPILNEALIKVSDEKNIDFKKPLPEKINFEDLKIEIEKTNDITSDIISYLKKQGLYYSDENAVSINK